MSPLAEEAIALGGFDVIVNREGEDIVGQLCDTLLSWACSTISCPGQGSSARIWGQPP